MTKYPFCPNCGHEGNLKVIIKEETIDIKGTAITVKSEVTHCSNCGIDFSGLEKTFDVINEARRIYREMHQIPSPEVIKALMDKYKFSLRDMEHLTGIAFKTIDRYLKGAIPDPSNAKYLSTLIEFPEVVLNLMERQDHFEAPRYKETKKNLQEQLEAYFSSNCPQCKIKVKFQSSPVSKNRTQLIVDSTRGRSQSVEINKEELREEKVFQKVITNRFLIESTTEKLREGKKVQIEVRLKEGERSKPDALEKVAYAC